MRFLFILLLVFIGFNSLSTHNRGGEITYVHVGGNTYRFTISTCTKSTAPAKRAELFLDYGDGTGIDTVRRSSITMLSNNSQKNYYITTHTFAGSGTYRVTMEDPNRNGGVINVGGATNSDQISFCIATEIVISPFLGVNNSVKFNDCPCPELACINKRYCYNPQATDPDGDSLSYKLVPCLGTGCTSLSTPAVYQYPDSYGGTISINPQSGTMCWVNPAQLGEYNIAILIEEWRNGIKIGSVLRDIQLTVDNCNNDPPVINTITDTCVVAGDTLSIPVLATDVNLGDIITLTATGAPISSSTATFPSVVGVSPVSGVFNWKTNCLDIRKASYNVYFTAEDNGTRVKLSDYKLLRIKVKAPAPTGLVVTPLSGTVKLKWNKSSCSNATGYKIYRKKGRTTTSNDCCNYSSPTDLGYSFVGSTNSISDTSFTDLSSLSIGEEYCYVITAIFPINIESCISTEECMKLKKDVPVITHVTVNKTDATIGVDSIMWSKASDLDTVTNYPPPYLYKIYQKNGFTGANTLIHTSPTYNFLYLSDTIFVHNNINTSDNANNYKVVMYHIVGPDTLIIGGSSSASSIFLTSTPNDNIIELSWSETVAWTNFSYEIYRGNSIGGSFSLIGNTTIQKYVDSNLINGVTYCYKIKSIGNYSDPSIISPIHNFSQEICDSPIDLTPPCPPVLEIDKSCEDELNYIKWTNPNNFCTDDVTRYRLFYSPTKDGIFTEIEFKNSAVDTQFTHSDNGSIAGCYYVTALDSVQYNNESKPSNVICVDNCPYYFLPNVFSPDGDGINDLFHPILPYKYIDSVDFYILNRWGQIVYQTHNPMINWDGKNQETGKEVSDGVYYYTCVIYGRRIFGLDQTKLKGSISLFRNKGRNSN